MAGTFSPTIRPVLPGVYTRYEAAKRTTLPPAPGGIVAVPFTNDWGPLDSPQLLSSFAQFEQLYGDTPNTPGRKAVYGAFQGEGLEGFGGASGVLAVRFAGTTAAKATISVNNPAAAPAIRFDALYEGSRANTLKIVTGPIVANTQEVSVLDGTVEVESFTFLTNVAPALATLAATVNASSDWVRATVLVEGVTGLIAATSALAAGNDGSALVAADWTAVLPLFDNDDFAFFAPFDVPWASGAGAPEVATRAIAASIVGWTQAQNDLGHRFTTVTGGALGEIVADCVARSQAIANENVITVGSPGVDDEQFGSMSSSQLVPRVAGIFAQRGEGRAAHFARLAGTALRLTTGGTTYSTSEHETLVAAGVVSLQRDRYQVAPVRIVKSVNTYVADAALKPRAVYGNPKFMLSMQQFANDAEAEIEREMVGKTVVSNATREAAAARVLRLAQGRESNGAFQPGTIVTPRAGSDDDEFVDLDVTIAFGRALAQLFIHGKVR